MPNYDISASQEAARLGISRSTLVDAIRAGRCEGEERSGYWYTSEAATVEWYKSHYRHKGRPYSPAVGRVWKEEEIAILRDMLAAGSPMADVAAKLKRSPGSIKVKLSKLRAAGEILPAAEAKELQRKKTLVAEAMEVLAEEAPEEAQDWYQERRTATKEGRLRLHLHPAVVPILGRAAQAAGVSLATFLTRAGLAAAADPEVLERGRIEAEKLS
uniref:Uncharacterized protein n=1 Tax=Desulfovibrio sp. U5L TaxID=596152 RepID=I2Q2P9_9BACT